MRYSLTALASLRTSNAVVLSRCVRAACFSFAAIFLTGCLGRSSTDDDPLESDGCFVDCPEEALGLVDGGVDLRPSAADPGSVMGTPGLQPGVSPGSPGSPGMPGIVTGPAPVTMPPPTATLVPGTTNPPPAPVCGDGRIDQGLEECDDGNVTPGDGCEPDCTLTPVPGGSMMMIACGDAILQPGEQCDDGNSLGGDGCSEACQVEPGHVCEEPGQQCQAVCGDSIWAPSESCDDGNDVPEDGCSETCQVEAGYECVAPAWACRPLCGDGLWLPGEECEDGNASPGDGCDERCRQEPGFVCEAVGPCRPILCGDGLVEADEGCDDGENGIVGDGCSPGCRLEPDCTAPDGSCVTVCGDFILTAESGELCDDGNRRSGDGCSKDCLLEAGFGCMAVVDADEPDNSAFDIVSLGHTVCAPTCGDGRVVMGEQCDDADFNGVGYGYCAADCTLGPRCGDGILQEQDGEQCDDGVNEDPYAVDPDACGPECVLPGRCGDGVIDPFFELCDDGSAPAPFTFGPCTTECPQGPRCGDGVVQPELGEECDDGNLVAGDGCGPTCAAQRTVTAR